jgi:DNA repair protein RecO (recombination protein O)
LIINDTAIVINSALTGENSIILTLASKENGIIKAYANRNKRNYNIYELGNIVSINYRRKDEYKYGSVTSELEQSFSFKVLDNKIAMHAIILVCNICSHVFDKSLPDNSIYFDILKCLSDICKGHSSESAIALHIINLELSILKKTGFGIDFTRCHVTGSNDNLAYISPKTGNVVCYEVGKAFEDKLFSLPKWIITSEDPSYDDIIGASKITSHFLNKYYGTYANNNISYYKNTIFK